MASAQVFHHKYYNTNFGFFFLLQIFFLSLKTYMKRLGRTQAGVKASTTLPDIQNLWTQLLLSLGTAQLRPVAMPGLQSPPKYGDFLASSSAPNKHISAGPGLLMYCEQQKTSSGGAPVKAPTDKSFGNVLQCISNLTTVWPWFLKA